MTIYVWGVFSDLRVSRQAYPSPSGLGEELIVLDTRWSALHVIQIPVLVQVVIAWITASPE